MLRNRPLLWSAAVVLTAAAACAAPSHSATPRATAGPRPPAAGPSPQTSAVPSAGLDWVGVLLDDEDHWCTASVVDSPHGNVVATAAHCVFEYGTYASDFSFAPGFRGSGEGASPHGTWRVAAVQVDDRWLKDGDEAYDYAFLALEPDARGRQVQDVVGAARPEWMSGPDRRVTVVGYPNADHNPAHRPIACTTDARHDADQPPEMLRIECAGFWDGTSGSPWLADHVDPARPGRVIGVLSGGDTDTESTAVLFGARARALYDKAARVRVPAGPGR
ncbi:trypsin-like serine protease [Streptomyces sp. HNM0645]|uniref:trypsin-like serine peptidase n=1 Tax=Streptomyces sp. HNM0645 TaxID=2782343 RepID=UPI0024B6FC96|nr:trypsin-like serine protease [Streptomyces sp. HNM0645]MDI9888398.1 trypsin-like serine protease [Streptomyces sp. HNM0645]